MNVCYYAAADSAVFPCQEMTATARLLQQQQKPAAAAAAAAARKRDRSAIVEDDECGGQADCVQLFEQLGCNNSNQGPGPQLLEDFHSFLAREGCSNHPWIASSSLNADLPTSDEDFVAYLARYNGISDSSTITKLRQVLAPPRKPRTVRQWQRVV